MKNEQCYQPHIVCFLIRLQVMPVFILPMSQSFVSRSSAAHDLFHSTQSILVTSLVLGIKPVASFLSETARCLQTPQHLASTTLQFNKKNSPKSISSPNHLHLHNVPSRPLHANPPLPSNPRYRNCDLDSSPGSSFQHLGPSDVALRRGNLDDTRSLGPSLLLHHITAPPTHPLWSRCR